jgi:hypothetical protein
VADITSVPIVNPKLVLASAAVVAPVPPFAIAIVVPLQVPLVIVPTVFKFDKDVSVLFAVAVILPAVVAVVALPDKSPIKFGAVTVALNVFAPAKVCAPVVTTPPFVASAGVNINSVVPLIVAPFALEIPDILPIELNPELEAVMEAFTYSVVANFVELSLVAGVGAVGVPVNAGEANEAFNNISALFEVILAVFAFTFDVNELILFVLVVMLAVLDVILVSNAASALVALETSAVMLAVFDVILVSNAASALVALVTSAVMLAVFAFILVGKLEMVLELKPPTLFIVVAIVRAPEPTTSPVKVVVAVADITSVPITNPKFVLASAALVAPVPPFVIAMVPFILLDVILLSATPALALC